MAKASDVTIEILEQVRDGVSATNTRLDDTNHRLREMNERLGGVEAAVVETNQRVGVVESTLLELAQQQRFVVRRLVAAGHREHDHARDIEDLRTRVEQFERRVP